MGRATTKRDMVKRIAAETNTSRAVVRQIVQQFLDDVVDELAHGHRIEFRDFGVFETTRRKPRVARNPRTGLAIHVPAKTVVNFRQGRVMKERVAALDAKEPTPEGPLEPAPERPSAPAEDPAAEAPSAPAEEPAPETPPAPAEGPAAEAPAEEPAPETPPAPAEGPAPDDGPEPAPGEPPSLP